jgi:hypothetical protein
MKSCLCQFSVFAKIGVVLILLINASSHPVLGQEKQKDDGPAAARTAILDRLRKACESDTDLRGVLIRDAKDDAGAGKKRALKLEGSFDRAEQRTLLDKKAREYLDLSQAWRDAYPGGIILDAMKISAIRSQYFAMLKKDFAQGQLPRGTDEKDAKRLTRMMSQTRLDDVYCHVKDADVELVVEGVCIVTDGDKKLDDVRKDLEQLIERLVQKDYAAPEWSKVKINVATAMLVTNPLPAFQTKLSDKSADEIIFQDASYGADGVLLLKGWVGRAEFERCRKVFEEQLAAQECVAVRGKMPRFSLDGMTKIDWPIDKKKWNLTLAQSADADLKKTHVLRVYFDVAGLNDAQLRCDLATFSNPQGTKEEQAAANQEIEQKIRKHLDELWAKDWRETHDRFKKNLRPAITPYGKVKDELQRAVVNDLGIKQALIVKVLYDPDSVLVVEGVVGSEEQKTAIARYLKTTEWAKWSGGRTSLEGLQVEPWPAKLKLFQSALANHADGLYKETRLDDAYLAYAQGETDLALRFAGVTLHEALSGDQKTQFRNLLKDTCVSQWPMLHEHIRGNIAIDIQPIPPQDMALHDQIEAAPALDGVWLDKGATFNDDGKLVLVGRWRGAKQEKDLKKLIDAHFANKPLRANLRGIVFDQLDVVPTERILEDLKRWVAQTKKEDIRPDRLYFDKAGSLHILLGNKAAEDTNIDALKDELRRLIKLLPEKQRALKVAVEFRSAAPAIAFVVFLENVQAGPVRPLAKHLREKVVVPGDPRWDGVLIERGYYGVDGTYNIEGLVDHPKQIDLLEQSLKKLAQSFEWGAALDKGWKLSLREMPIRPMLKAIRDVMMEYAEFDRLKLEDRAYHGPDKKLMLRGFSTGADKDKAAARFAQILLAHPQWRERVEAWWLDPEVDAKTRASRKPEVGLDITAVAVDPKAARLAVNRAFTALTDNLPDYVNDPGQGSPASGQPFYLYSCGCWGPIIVAYAKDSPAAAAPKTPDKFPPRAVLDKCIDYLDVALFHSPEESATWYLRAACHLAAGNEAIALRDLRRMNEIEMQDAEAQTERLKAIEMFQGDLRQRTAALAEKARLQLAGGYRTPSLAEVQVAAK